MTQDEIISMMKEAGFYFGKDDEFMPEWECFAALVAAHSFNDGWIKGNKGLMEAVREEREACAMVCDEIAVEADAMTKSKFVTNTGRMLEEGKWGGSTDCAAAIRARGEK